MAGLALFWKDGVELEIVLLDQNVIVALMYSDPPDSPWMLFAIYDTYRKNRRSRFWDMLKNWTKAYLGPWVIICDLNCIKRAEEKKRRQICV